MTRLPIALSFSLQCRRGWISSTAVKVCLTKRSRDSWPHGLQADLVSGLPRRPSTISLLYFPEIGRVVPEYSLPTMREITVRSYRIVYRVDHTRKFVEIARVWHAARGTPELG